MFSRVYDIQSRIFCTLQIVYDEYIYAYEISKKNFLTDKRSVFFYILPFRCRFDIDLRVSLRTEFIRAKNISFVKGERDNFYRGGRKVILTRCGVRA